MPVASENRLGAQTPETENVRVKRIPSRAKRDRVGVAKVESPNGAMLGLMSSATSHRIFGGCDSSVIVAERWQPKCRSTRINASRCMVVSLWRAEMLFGNSC